MSFTSRVSTRVLVVAAVVGLTASLAGAAFAERDATSPETADNAPGPTAPGLTVSKVSGEAFGGEAEESVTFLEPVDEGSTATSIDQQALIDAIRKHDIGAVRDVLGAAGIDTVTAAGTPTQTVTLSGEAGPDPEVELPAAGGGPLKDSEDTLKIKLTGSGGSGTNVIAKDLSVVTEGWPGDTGWARSEATAHQVEGDEVFAEKVDSECRADLSGVRGSTDVEDGSYFDENGDLQRVPSHPDPNEELNDFEISESAGTIAFHLVDSIVANAQDKDPNAITVTGLVEKARFDVVDNSTNPPTPFLSFEFEMRIAQSHCDIHPDPVVQVAEPKFTG